MSLVMDLTANHLTSKIKDGDGDGDGDGEGEGDGSIGR